MARLSGLIAAPPGIRAEIIENNGVRLILADELKVTREVIFLLFAVFALAAGVIEPHAENIAVAGQKFRQLVAEVIVIFRRAVIL